MPGECFTSEPTPAAKFKFVAVDIDTTGKRLIDEIIQLSAYTPEKQLNQYIMPYNNLNQAAKMKHQVRVINLGIFRMLKNMHTHKVIKTKSEYAALKEFLDWLDELRAEDADGAEVPSKGIVLIFHEQRQFIPCMLLGALKRYDLLDRFSATIVGFGNNYWLAERKCCQPPLKYLSLPQLAKMFLDMSDAEEKTLFEGCASVRSKLAYDIFHYLLSQPVHDANGNEVESILDKMDLLSLETGTVSSATSDDGGDSCGGSNKANELKKLKAAAAIVAAGGTPTGHNVIINVEESLHILSAQQDVIKRQNSLRPLFVNYFRGKIYHRLLAVDCRRSLAEHGYDIEKLQEIWNEKKTEGITEILDELNLGEEKKEELVKIIDAHFDPEKSPMKPARNQSNRRDFRPRNKNFRPSALSTVVEVKN